MKRVVRICSLAEKRKHLVSGVQALEQKLIQGSNLSIETGDNVYTFHINWEDSSLEIIVEAKDTEERRRVVLPPLILMRLYEWLDTGEELEEAL